VSDFTFSGYLEQEEVRAIINALPAVSCHAERDTLFFELMWQSGARVSEAATLVPEHIGMTSIVLRNLKQHKRIRDEATGRIKKVSDPSALKEVEISASLCQSLKDYCDRNKIHEGDYVFKATKGSGHIRRWYAWNIFNKASEAARVYKFGKKHPRTGGRFKGACPHMLRHSNAMKLLEETKDIMIVKQQLGHASVRTTQGYAYVRAPRIRKEIAKMSWE